MKTGNYLQQTDVFLTIFRFGFCYFFFFFPPQDFVLSRVTGGYLHEHPPLPLRCYASAAALESAELLLHNAVCFLCCGSVQLIGSFPGPLLLFVFSPRPIPS